MNMTRSIDAEVNDEDLSFDNMAEIVKLDNTAGRRDVTTIAGNANPKEGEFATSLKERDASATELITFSPPTGMNAKTILAIQIALVTILGLGIVSAGIIVITSPTAGVLCGQKGCATGTERRRNLQRVCNVLPAGNPDSCSRRTNHFGYCELYPVRQGKGLFSDRAAGYGDCEIECGEEVGHLFVW